MTTRIVAIANEKGGTGKTTTAHALGRALAARGRRVLMVDLDPQASLSLACGLQDAAGESMAEVLLGERELAGIVYDLGDGLFIAPSDIRLAEVELWAVSQIGRERLLANALDGARADYVLIDCQPSLGLLVVNALAAAGEVLIPVRPDFLSVRGVQLFLDTAARVRKAINPSLRVRGILPTFVNPLATHHQAQLARLGEFGVPVAPVAVRQSIKVAEAAEAGRAISETSHHAGEAYRELAAWMEQHG